MTTGDLVPRTIPILDVGEEIFISNYVVGPTSRNSTNYSVDTYTISNAGWYWIDVEMSLNTTFAASQNTFGVLSTDSDPNTLTWAPTQPGSRTPNQYTTSNFMLTDYTTSGRAICKINNIRAYLHAGQVLYLKTQHFSGPTTPFTTTHNVRITFFRYR